MQIWQKNFGSYIVMSFSGKPKLIKSNLLKKMWAQFLAAQVSIPHIRVTHFENFYVMDINILNSSVESRSLKIKLRVNMKKKYW